MLCEQRGAVRDQGLALLVLGRTLADLGDTGAAVVRARQAHMLFTRLGLPDADHTAALLKVLGDLL